MGEVEGFTGTREETDRDRTSQGAKTLSEDQNPPKKGFLPGRFFTRGRKRNSRHLRTKQRLPHRSKGKPEGWRDGSVCNSRGFNLFSGLHRHAHGTQIYIH